jgi:hypothetical protein
MNLTVTMKTNRMTCLNKPNLRYGVNYITKFTTMMHPNDMFTFCRDDNFCGHAALLLLQNYLYLRQQSCCC